LKGLWTPYRKGLLITLSGTASALFIFFGFLAVVTGKADLPVWLFIVAIAIGTITAHWLDPLRTSRNDPARCPECGKSVFQSWGGASFLTVNLIWPERQCSECGADLTGGRGHGYGP
jgi:hypothetical protein